MKRSTQLIHNPAMTDTTFGEASPAIFRASTFNQHVESNDVPYAYSRLKNPTRSALEESVAELEGGARGLAFSSGMAAIAASLQILEPGSHIIAPRDLYGGTDHLLRHMMARKELSVSFVDMTSLDDMKNHITPETRAIYVESPSNPTLRITDLKAVVQLAQQSSLLTIADNTFMSPYLQRPLSLGFDIVVHSATKFLGGHSDVIAGIAVARDMVWGQRLAEIQTMYGGILGPDDAWMVIRGMKTLGVRLDRAQQNAIALAEFFVNHEAVSHVYYPGLSFHPGYQVHQSQADGPGAVLSFVLQPGVSYKDVVGALHYSVYGVSLGGVETIVSHPITMSHAGMDPTTREAIGITDQLLRVSVGIEDIDDLIGDFRQALDKGLQLRKTSRAVAPHSS